MADSRDAFETDKPRIERAISMLSAAFTDPSLSLTKLSQALGLCEDHLGRMLKEKTGLSFQEHRRKLRIEQAKHLLLHSDKEVKEIAVAVGYRSQSYFARDFRKYIGMSPRTFRKTPPPPSTPDRMSDLC